MTLPELLGKLERGRIGHAEAMRWLNIDSYRELVEVMHANGRQMPGHKPYELSSETAEVLRKVTVRPTLAAE